MHIMSKSISPRESFLSKEGTIIDNALACIERFLINLIFPKQKNYPKMFVWYFRTYQCKRYMSVWYSFYSGDVLVTNSASIPLTSKSGNIIATLLQYSRLGSECEFYFHSHFRLVNLLWDWRSIQFILFWFVVMVHLKYYLVRLQ